MASKFSKVAKKIKMNIQDFRALDLSKEKFYRAVGEGPSIGNWWCQVYFSKAENDDSCYAFLEESISAGETKHHAWKVDENFFEVINAAYDEGLDDDFHNRQADAVSSAIDAFQQLILAYDETPAS